LAAQQPDEMRAAIDEIIGNIQGNDSLVAQDVEEMTPQVVAMNSFHDKDFVRPFEHLRSHSCESIAGSTSRPYGGKAGVMLEHFFRGR